MTLNPHEISGIARACGLDRRIPLIVSSAELGTVSKVAMAEHARSVLGFPLGVSTTVLIDNKEHNIAEFVAAGGRAILHERGTRCLDALAEMIPA